MPRYRVEIVTTYYDIVEIAAESEEEARANARVSQLNHGEFSESVVAGIEQLRMDYDEALYDAGLL